jgi:hypothetical protein
MAPAQEQWGTMQRTMGNNEKNNARSNGNNEKSGRVPTSGCGMTRQATALRASPREPRLDGPSLFAAFVDEPGRSCQLPSQQSADARNNEITSFAALRA